jgi:hypothetical protein
MPGYFVASYTITRDAEYKEYPAAAGPTPCEGTEGIILDIGGQSSPS